MLRFFSKLILANNQRAPSAINLGMSLSPRALLEQSIPPPPTISAPLSSSPQRAHISLINETGQYTKNCVNTLEYHLLNRRRTPVIPLSVSPTPDLKDYVKSQIVQPVIHLCNVLSDLEYYPAIRYNISQDNDETLATIRVDVSNELDKYKFPVIFFLPPSSLRCNTDRSGAVPLRLLKSTDTDTIPSFLSREVPVIVSDFQTTFAITRLEVENDIAYIECANSATPLRYIMASYIFQRLPRGQLDLNKSYMRNTLGAPTNPNILPPSNEQVLATRHCHADFDRYTLINSKAALEQFFWWKLQMQTQPKVAMMPGTVLYGKTNAFPMLSFQPRYALEPLPESTEAHLRSSRRSVFARFSEALKEARTFSLVLDEELTPEGGTGYARTFTCSITGIDGSDVVVPVPSKLIVKLFDDASARIPDPEVTQHFNTLLWSQSYCTAEDMLLTETNAYIRLSHAWGSVIPWFYGVHQFTLPDGRTLSGLLIEYISRSEKALKDHSETSQIGFIQSARHAVRVLQRADVSQLDWSDKQWIIHAHSEDQPSGGDVQLTCVLIDFGLTSQGDVVYDADTQDNYGEMADSMLYNPKWEQNIGISIELIRQWYEPREPWDFHRSSWVMDKTGEV